MPFRPFLLNSSARLVPAPPLLGAGNRNTSLLKRALPLVVLAVFVVGCSTHRAVPSSSIVAGPAQPPPAVEIRSPDQAIASGNSMRITGVTLFDGEKILERATVVITDGWIREVCSDDHSPCAPRGEPAVDGSGKFLMPSMIDAEGHFGRPNEMLSELLTHHAPVCAGEKGSAGRVLRPSTSEIFEAFARRKLFTEVDTHGLRLGNGAQPRKLSGRYNISTALTTRSTFGLA